MTNNRLKFMKNEIIEDVTTQRLRESVTPPSSSTSRAGPTSTD